MNPFDFPPLAALLELAASGLAALGALVTPAGAIVLVTIAIRTLLIPVGVSVARAAQNRRRLAPQIAALQRRYRKNPQKLQQETMALYTAEKVSPFAGCLPMLAQMPVISTVYALFALPLIAGSPNALLAAPFLAGTPLASTLGRHLGDAFAAPVWGDLVFPVVVVVLLGVAWLNRRLTLRDAPPVSDAAAAPAVPGGAALDPRGPLSWAPFLTAAAVFVVPLAASIYIVVSGVWSYLERSLLRRIYA